MKVFVTGATGFVGSEVSDVLLKDGHEVTAIARNEEGLKKLQAKGVKAVKGDLYSLDVLKREAAAADGTIHLAFIHDFTNFEKSIQTELTVVSGIVEALKGSDKPFLMTSGSALHGDRQDEPDETLAPPEKLGRVQAEKIALEGAKSGVRGAVVRLPMYTFGDTGAAFSDIQEYKAKEIGYVPYIGKGTQCTSVIHVKDAARLYVKALLLAKPGGIWHATDGRIAAKDVATALSARTGLPARSVTVEEASQIYMPFFAHFFASNVVADSKRTRRELEWEPQYSPELFLENLAKKRAA